MFDNIDSNEQSILPIHPPPQTQIHRYSNLYSPLHRKLPTNNLLTNPPTVLADKHQMLLIDKDNRIYIVGFDCFCHICGSCVFCILDCQDC